MTSLSSIGRSGCFDRGSCASLFKFPTLRSTAASLDGTSDPPPTATKVPARKTVKKLLPLGLMLFFILFNYTILRDTKDVLIVTTAGAELIPYLKTYCNLPISIAFTLLYSALCNRMSPDKVFYAVLSVFLSFFAAFAGFICKW